MKAAEAIRSVGWTTKWLKYKATKSKGAVMGLPPHVNFQRAKEAYEDLYQRSRDSLVAIERADFQIPANIKGVEEISQTVILFRVTSPNGF